MTDKEKLIKFMEKKQEIITEFNSEFEGMYFNDRDRALIEEWEEDTCKRIWEHTKDNVDLGDDGLYSFTCPFCHYYTFGSEKVVTRILCTQCKYVNNHGGFNKDSGCGNHWALITMDEGIHRQFYNDVYQIIIEEIDNDS